MNNKIKKIDSYLFYTAILLSLFQFYCMKGYAQTDIISKQLIIEEIKIDGNTKTKSEVIMQYLSLRLGDVIDTETIAKNKESLSKTNFFKHADIYTAPGSEKGKIVVIVEVEERKWPYYRFEGGYGELDGWYIVPVSFRFDNLFGEGNYIGWQWKVGNRKNTTSWTYRNANIFENLAYVEAEFNHSFLDVVHFINSEDTATQVQEEVFRFQIGGLTGIKKYLFTEFKFAYYNPEYIYELAPYLKTDFLRTNITSFIFGLHKDLRDNTLYPTNGKWGSMTMQLSFKEFGTDGTYSKLNLDVRTYQRHKKFNVIALHLNAGFTTTSAPFYDRFYLGGAYSLRGHDYCRLTPLGWGNKLLLAQAEYRIPLSKTDYPFHKHTAVLFFDAGGNWGTDHWPHVNDIYSTCGIGYRIKLPIVSILRVDLALPLNKIDKYDPYFHLSLGHTF